MCPSHVDYEVERGKLLEYRHLKQFSENGGGGIRTPVKFSVCQPEGWQVHAAERSTGPFSRLRRVRLHSPLLRSNAGHQEWCFAFFINSSFLRLFFLLPAWANLPRAPAAGMPALFGAPPVTSSLFASLKVGAFMW